MSVKYLPPSVLSKPSPPPPVIIGPVLPAPSRPPNGIFANFAACAAVPDPPNCGG